MKLSKHDWQTRRREYGGLSLSKQEICADPIEQFEKWFTEVIATEQTDATAMHLATVDENGCPDSRVVLLKGIEKHAFLFYTNYQSAKGIQLRAHPYAALTFYWPSLARQVRIRGHVSQVDEVSSDAYFANRPRMSQLSAWASPQSQVLADRLTLESRMQTVMERYADGQSIPRPDDWGGYALSADTVEFWQGRDNRLHDRIRYYKKNGRWQFERLAP